MSRKTERTAVKKKKTVQTVICALLVLVLAGSVFMGMNYRGRTAQLRMENEKATAEAQAALDEAKAAYNQVDPNSLEGSENQLAQDRQLVDAAKEKAAEMEAELGSLDEEIARLQSEVETKEADEEISYYLTVYNAWLDGMTKVEA